MKKLITFLTMVLMIVSTQPVFAEDTEIEGLHENWSKLFMTNYFTEEELAQIDNNYMTIKEYRLRNLNIPQKQALHMMETNSFENEVALELERATLNYTNAVRVSLLYTNKYAEEYSEQGKFIYLFGEDEYWSVANSRFSDCGKFTLDGDYIEDTNSYFSYGFQGLILPLEMHEWLRDEENIKSIAEEKNIQIVSDIKIFTPIHSNTFMYVNSDKGEFIAILYPDEQKFETYENIERAKLYPIDEIMDAIKNDQENSYIQRQKLAKQVALEKPTYQTEAEALQAEGLLYGNENGLDLLKPLSRIETAAMLLRALGESETADTSSAQVFTDVAPTHWGYGAAQNAYSLGLIYGVGDNLFAPDRKVTATEFSSMILRAMGENDFDWQSATDILIERGILTAEEAETMDLFTRGDMAKIIYEVRNRGLIG